MSRRTEGRLHAGSANARLDLLGGVGNALHPKRRATQHAKHLPSLGSTLGERRWRRNGCITGRGYRLPELLQKLVCRCMAREKLFVQVDRQLLYCGSWMQFFLLFHILQHGIKGGPHRRAWRFKVANV